MTDLLQPSSGFLASGVLGEAVHRFALRVYFADTDLSGVVYHANYLRWFEQARSELLRLLGIEQRSVQEAGGGAYAVAELTIRYLRPARLDDQVVIETRAEELRAASCKMHQQAWRGADLLTEARLRIGFVGPDGRPRRQPEAWRRAFAAISPERPTE
jgi:acyl-CoA thioester hydrolase